MGCRLKMERWRKCLPSNFPCFPSGGYSLKQSIFILIGGSEVHICLKFYFKKYIKNKIAIETTRCMLSSSLYKIIFYNWHFGMYIEEDIFIYFFKIHHNN